MVCHDACFLFFFFNDTATTEIYTLSLHDALPIYPVRRGDLGRRRPHRPRGDGGRLPRGGRGRREARGVADPSGDRSPQGSRVSPRQQGRDARAGAPALRRPAQALQRVLRRRRLDRAPLPAAGRSRHALRDHGRRPVHRGWNRYGTGSRYAEAGSGSERPAGELSAGTAQGVAPTCMRFDDFRAMIHRLARDVPAEFSDGIVAIEVSPKTLPHPRRGDVYTFGECIPLEWSGSGADLQSRVVLYHGSFAALARLGDFDWRAEAWETLTQ